MSRIPAAIRPARVGLALVVAAVLMLASATPAASALPWFVIVYGEALAEPVVFDNRSDEHLSPGEPQSTITSLDELGGRPYLDLALVWGEAWEDYPADPASLARITPADGTERGRFYLAVGDEPAELAYFAYLRPDGAEIRRVTSDALAVLESRGVPTQVNELPAESGSESGGLTVALAALAAAASAAVAALVVRRRRGARAT